MKKHEMILYLVTLLTLLLLAGYILQVHADLQKQHDVLARELAEAREQVFVLQAENSFAWAEHERLQEVIRELRERERIMEAMRDWLEAWQVIEFEITGYAPLDPGAKEGMCYEGDPNVTYSGEPPVPGETAAGHVSRLGRTVFVPGMGFYRINDIGGLVGEYNLDLVFASRQDALRWGRKTLTVVIER